MDIQLSKYVACICEGSAEQAIIDLLLEHNLLIFNREQLLDEQVIRCRDARTFETRYLRKGFNDKISIIRILDSRRENFKLSKAYQHKVDVINVITAPEIEMLIIHSEDKYKDFKKSGKKPSDFCKQDLKMKDVKTYQYYLIYNGEFAYNKSTSSDAPWGAIKRLDRYENGVLSTLYIVFKIKNEKVINSDFLVTYYDTCNWHKDIKAVAAEGARNHGLLNIAPADFFKTELMLPQDIEEQKKIGSYFKLIDHLITLHQHKCNELREIKKYMLKNMFI